MILIELIIEIRMCAQMYLKIFIYSIYIHDQYKKVYI